MPARALSVGEHPQDLVFTAGQLQSVHVATARGVHGEYLPEQLGRDRPATAGRRPHAGHHPRGGDVAKDDNASDLALVQLQRLSLLGIVRWPDEAHVTAARRGVARRDVDLDD